MKTYVIRLAETDAVVAEYTTAAEAFDAFENVFTATDDTGLGLFVLEVKEAS